MKRITLWMIAALLAMTSFAQDPEPVTAPDGLQLEEYALKAQTYTSTDNGYVYSDVTRSLMVGTDGTDVYIRGLCEFLPLAYVKGTKNGTKITFPGGQYLGKLVYTNGEVFEFYFGGTTEDYLTNWLETWPLTDVVFTVDETTGTMTTDSWMVINSEATNVVLPYDVTLNNSIVKITDVAATPATPTITYVYDIEQGSEVNYGGIYMTIPTLDTKGNALLTEKLSYRLFTAAGDDVQPYVIKANEHEFIDEDMTEIPYNFTDNYDIEYGGAAVYFYTPLTGFDKIGVQSVYRGGNEENTSEVFWYDLNGSPVEDLEGATFDFNALDKETTPVSSNKSTAGDITTDQVLETDGVKMTISPNDGTPANRYWVEYNKQVIQLRLYGGSLTFEAPEGSTIQKIGFYNDTWNPGNYVWDGTLTGGDGMALWEGDTDELVVHIESGGGGSGNTKLNKVVVVLNTPDGIRTVDVQPVTSTRYFDLQGREVPANTKGLLIKQQRMADGTMKSGKIVR